MRCYTRWWAHTPRKWRSFSSWRARREEGSRRPRQRCCPCARCDAMRHGAVQMFAGAWRPRVDHIFMRRAQHSLPCASEVIAARRPSCKGRPAARRPTRTHSGCMHKGPPERHARPGTAYGIGARKIRSTFQRATLGISINKPRGPGAAGRKTAPPQAKTWPWASAAWPRAPEEFGAWSIPELMR
jgi:hypothetical protein